MIARFLASLLLPFILGSALAAGPDCSRPYTLALHDHGLLYSAETNTGIANNERYRFASFAWYFSNKYYLLVRKDGGVQSLADFERNDKLQLGVIRSFRYSETANRFVDKLHAANRVNQAGGLAPLYQTLSQNRIQGMIIEPFDYPMLNEKGIRDQTSIIEFNDPAVPHGLIMSNKALASAEIEKWRALVDQMRADGAVPGCPVAFPHG